MLHCPSVPSGIYDDPLIKCSYELNAMRTHLILELNYSCFAATIYRESASVSEYKRLPIG